MKVLITVASKYGATAEIGKIIERVIATAGHEPHLRQPDDVTDLSAYDAVVLGSAVYAGNWRPTARKFADRYAQELLALPLWTFSSGPLGTEKESDTDMGTIITKRVDALMPIEHKVFRGKLDPEQLKLSEKMIVRMVKAPEGDYRDQNDIVAWAQSINDFLADLD